MSIIDSIVTGPPFWDDDPFPTGKVRLNGSQSHHCDVCPLKDGETRNIACHEARKKLDDGVEVTF